MYDWMGGFGKGMKKHADRPSFFLYRQNKHHRPQVNKPLSKLEGDVARLTSALTSEEGDARDAAGLQTPLFSLCADGYLLCEPN